MLLLMLVLVGTGLIGRGLSAGKAAKMGFAWLAIFAPPGTPQATLNAVNAVFRTAAVSPKVAEWMKGNAMDPFVSSPQELTALVKNDSAMFSDVIKKIGLTLDQ